VKLQEVIKEKFGSLQQFASVMSIPAPTVSNWCRGLAVSRKHRATVCMVLEIGMEDLQRLQVEALKENYRD
jgi:hypothetical protein